MTVLATIDVAVPQVEGSAPHGQHGQMTGRWVAVACFFATAVLLGHLGHRVLEPQQVRTVQAVFLFSPFGLFWSRAVLVEYLATAFALLSIPVPGQLALVGPDEKNVRQARFLVADDALSIGHPVREAPVSLQCDGVATIPLHRSGVNVVRFGPTGRDVWLRVGHGLADLPIRRTAVVSNTTPTGSEILDTIRCVGGGTIDVLGAGIRLKTAL